MSYPTTNLARSLGAVDGMLSGLKNTLQSRISLMVAGDVPASLILDVYRMLAADSVGLNTAKTIPGIGAYAQAQKSDETLDVVAEYNAVIAAITSALNWTVAAFPASGGYLLATQLTATGTTERQFTPAQTAGFRTILQSIVDLID